MQSFTEFLWLGRDQWRTYSNPLARAFVRLFGPLGVHARIRNSHMIRLLAESHPLCDAKILDAGCGHGYTLFWLARHCVNCDLDGVELDSELIAGNRLIAEAMDMDSLRFIEGDVGSVCCDRTYDVIFSIDLLEHVVDDIDVLRSWRSALSDDGVLLLHLPLRHQDQRRIFPSFRSHTIGDHVRDEYTREEISEKLTQSGFDIAILRYGFGPAGELAFELNFMFWERPALRAAIALATLPLSLALGYLDYLRPPLSGNSLLVVAKPR